MKTKTLLMGVAAFMLVVSWLVIGCGGGESTTSTRQESATTETTTIAETTTDTLQQSDFPKQDITWIVPFSPGGGMDSYSRAVAREMGKYLPGDVNVIVKNVTGGGGRRGTTEIYKASPDGYTIGMLNIPGAISTQLISETEYDLNQMSYVGRLATSKYGLSVAADSKFQTLEDLQQAEEPVRFSDTGPGSTGGIVTILTAEAMDIPYEMVPGYEGATEMLVGLIRGDTDALIGLPIDTQFPYIEDGDMKLLLTIDDERYPRSPDVPTVGELGYNDLADLGVQRLIAGPPGIPEDIRSILEEALLKTLDSEEMKSWSAEVDRPLEPATGPEAKAIISSLSESLMENTDALEGYVGSN